MLLISAIFVGKDSSITPHSIYTKDRIQEKSNTSAEFVAWVYCLHPTLSVTLVFILVNVTMCVVHVERNLLKSTILCLIKNYIMKKRLSVHQNVFFGKYCINRQFFFIFKSLSFSGFYFLSNYNQCNCISPIFPSVHNEFVWIKNVLQICPIISFRLFPVVGNPIYHKYPATFNSLHL